MIDIFNPERFGAGGVPYEDLRWLRTHDPVSWHAEPSVMGWPEGPGFWAVTRHADVKAVLHQPQLFSSQEGGTQLRNPPSPHALAFAQQSMLNMDPPEHTRLRSLLSRSFTPRAVRQIEATIHQRAAAIVDRALAGTDTATGEGRADFAKDIAADLPLLTLAELLGLPHCDRYLLFDWSNRVIGFQDPEYSRSSAFDRNAADATPMARASLEVRATIRPDANGLLPDPRTREGMVDLYAYANALAEEKRANPTDDIVSVLLHADHPDGKVTSEEFELLFFLFAVAGNETLRNGIPGGLLTLCQHPEQLAALVADPSLLPGAVEEILRFWPPVIHFRRTATADTSLGGRQVRRGDKVVVFFPAANRDPEVFGPSADRFDITRSPNDHLTFGAGTHFCLGAHLAREQMRAMYRQVLWRLPNLELDGQPVRLVSNFQNGIKHLPVRWRVPVRG
jgi:cytochrome P450